MAEQNVCIDLIRRPLHNSRWRECSENCSNMNPVAHYWLLSSCSFLETQVSFTSKRHLPKSTVKRLDDIVTFDRQIWRVIFSDRLFASMPAEQWFRRGSEICSSKNGDSHYCILSSISFRWTHTLFNLSASSPNRQSRDWVILSSGDGKWPSKMFG